MLRQQTISSGACSTKLRRAKTTLIGSGALVVVVAAAALPFWVGRSATGSASETRTSLSPSPVSTHERNTAQLAAGYATAEGNTSDAEHGRQLYANSCASCHGATAQGLPHQGVSLRASKFVWDRGDEALVRFLQQGRKPGDPGSRENLVMPPRGGNPALDDDSLRDIVAYLRVIQRDTYRTAAAK